MPTRHPRIQVTEDPELARALREAAPFLQAGLSRSRRVRDLAIVGARQLADDAAMSEEQRKEKLDELLSWFQAPGDGAVGLGDHAPSATTRQHTGDRHRYRRRSWAFDMGRWVSCASQSRTARSNLAAFARRRCWRGGSAPATSSSAVVSLIEDLYRDARSGAEALQVAVARLRRALATLSIEPIQPLETLRAVRGRRAGEDAIAKLAPREPLTVCDRRPQPLEEDRCELLIELGTAQRQSGDPEFRDTLLEPAPIAHRRGDAQRLVRAALTNTRGFVSATGGVDEERIAVLEDAPDAACARLSDEALAVARQTGDLRALVDVLSPRNVTIWRPGALPERLANTAEFRRAADLLDDPLAQLQSVPRRASVRIESGAFGEAAEQLAGEAGDLVAQSLEQNPRVTGFRSVLALACCEERRCGEAASLLPADARSGFSSLAYDLTCGVLAPWVAQIAYTGTGGWGCVEHHLGMRDLALCQAGAAATRRERALRRGELLAEATLGATRS